MNTTKIAALLTALIMALSMATFIAPAQAAAPAATNVACVKGGTTTWKNWNPYAFRKDTYLTSRFYFRRCDNFKTGRKWYEIYGIRGTLNQKSKCDNYARRHQQAVFEYSLPHGKVIYGDRKDFVIRVNCRDHKVSTVYKNIDAQMGKTFKVHDNYTLRMKLVRNNWWDAKVETTAEMFSNR